MDACLVKLNQFWFSEPHVFVLTCLLNAKSEREMMDPELPPDDLPLKGWGFDQHFVLEPACACARSFSVVKVCRECCSCD